MLVRNFFMVVTVVTALVFTGCKKDETTTPVQVKKVMDGGNIGSETPPQLPPKP